MDRPSSSKQRKFSIPASSEAKGNKSKRPSSSGSTSGRRPTSYEVLNLKKGKKRAPPDAEEKGITLSVSSPRPSSPVPNDQFYKEHRSGPAPMCNASNYNPADPPNHPSQFCQHVPSKSMGIRRTPRPSSCPVSMGSRLSTSARAPNPVALGAPIFRPGSPIFSPPKVFSPYQILLAQNFITGMDEHEIGAKDAEEELCNPSDYMDWESAGDSWITVETNTDVNHYDPYNNGSYPPKAEDMLIFPPFEKRKRRLEDLDIDEDFEVQPETDVQPLEDHPEPFDVQPRAIDKPPGKDMKRTKLTLPLDLFDNTDMDLVHPSKILEERYTRFLETIPFLNREGVDDNLLLRLMTRVGRNLSLSYSQVVKTFMDELKIEYHNAVNKAVLDFKYAVANDEWRAHYSGLQIFPGSESTAPATKQGCAPVRYAPSAPFILLRESMVINLVVAEECFLMVLQVFYKEMDISNTLLVNPQIFSLPRPFGVDDFRLMQDEYTRDVADSFRSVWIMRVLGVIDEVVPHGANLLDAPKQRLLAVVSRLSLVMSEQLQEIVLNSIRVFKRIWTDYFLVRTSQEEEPKPLPIGVRKEPLFRIKLSLEIDHFEFLPKLEVIESAIQSLFEGIVESVKGMDDLQTRLTDIFKHYHPKEMTTINLDDKVVSSAWAVIQSKGGGSSRRSSGYTPEKIGAAGSKSNLYCRYCKKKGHLFESYFKLQKKRDSKPVAGVVVSAVADSQNKVLMASQIGGSDQDHSWVVDTGATDHMACKREYFHTYEPLHSPKFVYLGDNSVHPMVGIGSVVVKLSSGEKVTIEQVYHVPGLFKNLFSGKQFSKKKGTLVFTDTCKR
ncbi:hypothetical protein R1flu_021500 [Riccia fluitans]|uniref:Retrovirus-related Pol polyprotein from transposon TNT 1-94-like beta-barrel domain-containing protein n=1 Tax=Riccia fluitans TaxID=41844 RepID=A0ABD1ZPJ2_9MARC